MLLSTFIRYRDLEKWHYKLGYRRHQICRVELGSDSHSLQMSTGFLVGPDVVLTTFHSIIRSPNASVAARPRDLIFRFDYFTQPEENVPTVGQEFALASTDWLLDFSVARTGKGLPPSETLDYALLRLNGSPGLEQLVATNSRGASVRGWINLLEEKYRFRLGEPLVILQHPEGRPLQIAFSADAVLKLDDPASRVTYNVDTSPGSSGAPCFNLDLDLVALHLGRASDLKANEGVPMSAIFASLQRRGKNNLVTLKPADVTTLYPSTPIDSVSFAPEPAILARIASGEGETTEFKETAVRNLKSGKFDETAKAKIVRSVAAFLNAKGGAVLIGVSDAGNVTGVNDDYSVANEKKPNWDGYQLFIANTLANNITLPDLRSYYTIRRYTLDGKDICCIAVTEAEDLAYVNKRMFVRYGNETTELLGPDLVSFVERRRKRQEARST